ARTGKEIRRFAGRQGMVRSIAVSPDGRLLVAGGGTLANTREKPLRLWEVATGKELTWADRGRGMVSAVAFAANGKTVVTAGTLLHPVTQRTVGRVIHLLDVGTGKVVASFPLMDGGAYILALSPDGKTVAAAGAAKDHDVRLFDLATGKERS